VVGEWRTEVVHGALKDKGSITYVLITKEDNFRRCILVGCYHCFEGTYYLHLQDRRLQILDVGTRGTRRLTNPELGNGKETIETARNRGKQEKVKTLEWA
jgi:hypothetical protein